MVGIKTLFILGLVLAGIRATTTTTTTTTTFPNTCATGVVPTHTSDCTSVTSGLTTGFSCCYIQYMAGSTNITGCYEGLGATVIQTALETTYTGVVVSCSATTYALSVLLLFLIAALF